MTQPQELSRAGSSLGSGLWRRLCVCVSVYFSGERVYRFFRDSVGVGNYLVTKFKPLLWGPQLDFLIIGALRGRRSVYLEAKGEALKDTQD